MTVAGRCIYNVFLVRADAEECRDHHKALGRRPRIHTRQVRAERIAVSVYVVVADITQETI